MMIIQKIVGSIVNGMENRGFPSCALIKVHHIKFFTPIIFFMKIATCIMLNTQSCSA